MILNMNIVMLKTTNMVIRMRWGTRTMKSKILNIGIALMKMTEVEYNIPMTKKSMLKFDTGIQAMKIMTKKMKWSMLNMKRPTKMI